jgi:predicted Zn-dependent protease with MMP-like domain
MTGGDSDVALWPHLVEAAEREAASVLEELPANVRGRLADIPVTFEPRPNPEMVSAGIHPDFTLGLFTGVPYPRGIAVSQRLPPQIILFLQNIRAYVRGDPAAFRAQVRRTLLHEIGHYLGLDERQVRGRGL